MDTNVIGRWRIERIFLRDLTPESEGNGTGIGLADIITQRLRDKIDLETTQINSRVSMFMLRVVLPIVAKNDREGLDTALYLLRRKPPEQVGMVRIRDTMRL